MLEQLVTNLSQYQEFLQKQLIPPNLVRKSHIIDCYQILVDFLEQKHCNSIKDIREAAKNYPILQQELNNSLQTVKELLNTKDIDQLFDAILKLEQTILKTDKTWKSKYRKKECNICESIRLLQDIFDQIYHFPDPIPGKDDHYASLDDQISLQPINELELENNSESEFAVTRLKSKVNSKANVDDSNKSIINELINGEENNYDNNELANCKVNDNNSSESINNELVNSEESDYDSETKSLSSLDADKTIIKQLFEKVFINDGLTCNSLMKKAYYSAQIFSLLCFNCDDTDIVTPIPATQYPLCTECTQKGVKTPTHEKSLKFIACIHKNKKKLVQK
ncbi:1442_t:CDS:2 [Cetraspora pellucida]|uniref:1442_t:CDS:1 n=1 Tax=Cetraspora pellucida TaxID=1433469 RepID=A0A9N9ESG8_9GLOM|nr:1442_t:CDS:2 [Cetraspora pellucida]